MVDINRFVWKIGGEAGYGIKSAGYIFAKFCIRHGLFVFSKTEYPSLIRGGHNSYTLRVEEKQIHSYISTVDILVALDKRTLDLHKDELTQNGVIIHDDTFKVDNIRQDIKVYALPLSKIAEKRLGEKKIMMNTVSIGATIALLDADLNHLTSILEERFKTKPKKIFEDNIKAAKAGYDFVKENNLTCEKKLVKKSENKNILVNGNEAMTLGAIKAGCKFVSIYPMTPINSILHMMARFSRDYGIVVKQPEDEISAINMAIGASFAGARALTATSGGGFCLMTEGVGLAGETETPVVIIEGQRSAPSTGMPTNTEQGDLKFVMNASQGDFPRIVIAPGDQEEAFYLTAEAFNIAEHYQTPVIVLTDKHLAESYKSVEPFDQEKIKIDRGLIATKIEEVPFKRYRFTDNGISPRSFPGLENGMHNAASDEHDEIGQIDESSANRNKMMEKRMKKLELAEKELQKPEIIGKKDADFTIVSWGSTKGAIIDAIDFLKEENITVNFLQIKFINPLHKDISQLMKAAKKTILVENNFTGQLGTVIKEKTGLDFDYRILKYDGRAFSSSELCDRIKKITYR
ncbi:2-oxoacid:acceptor oxidoreductase subunit alpha [Candidatus Woesearchaeota archaeon]|nr:MAG: 2-oxoacid:acceptor oxidoreductase subunit alpha [Candidatus Woesearchaeota archaeon]